MGTVLHFTEVSGSKRILLFPRISYVERIFSLLILSLSYLFISLFWCWTSYVTVIDSSFLFRSFGASITACSKGIFQTVQKTRRCQLGQLVEPQINVVLLYADREHHAPTHEKLAIWLSKDIIIEVPPCFCHICRQKIDMLFSSYRNLY